MRAANTFILRFLASLFTFVALQGRSQTAAEASLPDGVRAVWNLSQAQRESSATRERICLNGLWRWQPGKEGEDTIPVANWGHFKVPGCWPGITDYMQKDCQTVFPHPTWKDVRLGTISAAWYQREFEVPSAWSGRRIALSLEYLNSFAVVWVDGQPAGEVRFPAGEVELTTLCRPGQKHLLTLAVVAMPLKGVMLSYGDTFGAKKVQGRVERRGLCGDVYLLGTPAAARIAEVKVSTSVRKWEIAFDAALHGLEPGGEYRLRAQVTAKSGQPRRVQQRSVQRD